MRRVSRVSFSTETTWSTSAASGSASPTPETFTVNSTPRPSSAKSGTTAGRRLPSGAVGIDSGSTMVTVSLPSKLTRSGPIAVTAGSVRSTPCTSRVTVWDFALEAVLVSLSSARELSLVAVGAPLTSRSNRVSPVMPPSAAAAAPPTSTAHTTSPSHGRRPRDAAILPSTPGSPDSSAPTAPRPCCASRRRQRPPGRSAL